MEEKVLYDRKLLKLQDGRYCLMLQVGNKGYYHKVNGKFLRQKYWKAFMDDNNQMFFTMGELQQRIFRYIVDNVRNDGTTDICNNKNVPFKNANDLRLFFTNGLTSCATFEQFAQANNHFVVVHKEKDGSLTQFQVDTEQKMFEKLENYKERYGEDIYLGFLERNLNPLHLQGKFDEKMVELGKWYAIVAITDNGSEERKIYYRRSSNKRLLFTEDINEAKPFETKESAENSLSGFPPLKDNIEMHVEEQKMPVMIKKREYVKNIAEME